MGIEQGTKECLLYWTKKETSGMETLSQEDGKKVVGEREGTISWGVEEEGKPRELGVEGATSDRH